MIGAPKSSRRGGSILPLLTLALVGLMGCVALAIDLGVIMVARNQCQAAADSAAMAGARTLNGDPTTNNNYNNAVSAAANAAAANQVLSQQVPAAGVTVALGSYTYSASQSRFNVCLPRDPGDNYNLAQVTVTYSGQTSFAGVLGISGFNVTASATAAHRPRDVALILDFSGSMRFSTLLGLPYTGSRTGSNNPESVYPQFGHYSAASLQQTSTSYDSSGNAFDPANFTESDTADNNRPVVVQDFYQSTSPSAVAAFTAAPGGYGSTPGGDNFPHSNFDAGPGWATSVQDFVGSTKRNGKFESQGYDGYRIGGKAYSGYTQGPTYWGKTFFIWPPDPRSTKDWRQLYFFTPGGNPVTLNASLFDSGGNWLAPGSSTYKINYAAIFQWLNQTPNPFPTQLQAGRILYYSAMPDGTDTTLNNRFWTQFPLTDPNERFWKDYIDYVLGLQQTGTSSWNVITPQTGYGADFSWGTTQINTGFNPSTDGRYMDYTDNPLRPLTHFWFGPMTMVDFIGNFNLWYNSTPYATQYCWMPGTAHESPLYACKLGVQAALQDEQSNHPNDRLSLIMFSQPQASANDVYGGRFNRVRSPLGTNYSRMISALWFPPYTLDNPGTQIRPYDYANNLEVPRAEGMTCYAMGLMLAYNQFSGNAGLQSYNPSPAPVGDAGGLGRKGAQKVVILETDGLPNVTAGAGFSNNGPYQSYYNIRYNSSTPSAGEFPTGVSMYANNASNVTSQIYSVAGQIAAPDTASPPGYSTARKPALIHCIAFGPVFNSSSPSQSSGLATLQQIQYLGNTQSSASTPLPAYKIITGSDASMTANLRTAIGTILQNGIAVSLIQ